MKALAICIFFSSMSSAAGFRRSTMASSSSASGSGSDLALQDAATASNGTANESEGTLDAQGVAAVATHAAETVPAPDLNGDRIARDLGITPGDTCSAGGEPRNMGCSLGCSCQWHQQCYPKYIFIDDGAHSGADWTSRRFDVGACEPGMPILIIASVCLFVAALLVVVTGRMLLLGQFAARDAVDAAAAHLPPGPYVKPPMVVVPAAAVAAQAQSVAAASSDSPRPSKYKTLTAADSTDDLTAPLVASSSRSSTSSS